MQAPKAGTKLARGKTVELVVAVSPSEPEMVTVPDVTGLDMKKAITILKEAGLSVEQKMEREEATKVEPGAVLRQSLKPGSRVRPKATITLVFAVAPRDREVDGEIVLPDFSGSPIPKVEAFLRGGRACPRPGAGKGKQRAPGGDGDCPAPPCKDSHGERGEGDPAGSGERW